MRLSIKAVDDEKSRLPSLTRVGLAQSVEGVTRTENGLLEQTGSSGDGLQTRTAPRLLLGPQRQHLDLPAAAIGSLK